MKEVIWDKAILSLANLRAAVKRVNQHPELHVNVVELDTLDIFDLKVFIRAERVSFGHTNKWGKQMRLDNIQPHIQLAEGKYFKELFYVELIGPEKIRTPLPKEILHAN